MPSETVVLNQAQARLFMRLGEWKSWDDIKLARFQLGQPHLCIPFGVFHGLLENVLGRTVQYLEMATADTSRLADELDGIVGPPTLGDLLALGRRWRSGDLVWRGPVS